MPARCGHKPVQQKGQQQIGKGACRGHEQTLPRRAAGNGFLLREAQLFHLVAVFAHGGDIASEGKPGETVFRLAPMKGTEFRAHADGKGDDAYAHQAAGDEVPQLVEEDEAAQNQYDGQSGIPVGKNMQKKVHALRHARHAAACCRVWESRARMPSSAERI